jgi:hypothetical protein
MRLVKERKPEYIKEGKAIYNPGFVDCYQKPWYISHNYNIKYYGRFCEEGYPGNVSLEFDPLLGLIDKIENIKPALKKEIVTMIEEMEDAHYAETDSYRSSLPSAD